MPISPLPQNEISLELPGDSPLLKCDIVYVLILKLSTAAWEQMIIKCLLVLFIFTAGRAWAAPGAAVQALRAVELERQSQEREHGITRTRNFYFDRVRIDIAVGREQKSLLEKLVNGSRQRFLNADDVDALCQRVKSVMLDNALNTENFSCLIQDGSFEVRSGSSGP